MDAGSVNALHLQELGDPLRRALGIAEGHAAVKAGLLQDLDDGIRLAVEGDVHTELLDVRLVLLVLPNSDLCGIPLVDPGDVHDLPGDGGREEAQVFAIGHLVQQAGHIVDEAHVQHPVRLVQHHGLHRVHPNGAALHVVAEAPRSRHHDLGPLFQRVDLPADGLAAVETHRAYTRLERRQVPDLVRDLNGQLPGGSQDHCLNALILRVHMLHNGDAVGKRLAGAGGSLGNHILPVHHRGDAARLDRRGHSNIPFFDRAHDFR